MTTEVVIVGAGPTGLMAANQFARFGIDFIIIDSKDAPTIQSRAIAVTARSLEIYQQMGLSETVLEQGAKINSFNIYSDGKKKAEVKIGEIGVGLSDFHYLFAFEQSKNEELLSQNLIASNHQVLWNTEFIELKEHPDSIEVFAKQNNEPLIISAQYLIACDGAKSPIRRQLNFRFDGGTYENKFFVADVVMNWSLEYDRLVITPSEKNFCGFFPLKGDKCYRVLGTLPKTFHDNEDIAFKDIEKVIIQTLGLDVSFEKVNWFSVYKLHHRCVDKFNKGRVFLAGDSAHIHSPAGGQGMNTGLQDAYNIAWKLAFVLKKYANEKLLETYNEERLPFAKWLLRFTDRAFSVMTSDNWFVAKSRKYIGLNVVGVLVSMEFVKSRIFKTVSQIRYSYQGKTLSAPKMTTQKLGFKTGDRLPFIKDNYFESFKDASFHLLHISNSTIEIPLTLEMKEIFPFPVKQVENKLEQWKPFGVKSELFILLRPDNYIALISDTFDRAKIQKYLSTYFA